MKCRPDGRNTNVFLFSRLRPLGPGCPEDSPSLHWPDSAYDGREVVMVRFSSETERESDGLFTMMGAPSLSVDWGVAVAAALVTGL